MQARKIKKQLSAACNFAYTRLALNYYTYYETFLEDSLLSNRLAPLNAGYQALLGRFLEGECDVKALDGLRNRVKEEMETVTSYAETFQAYEYVLNRLEGRFAPQLLGDTDKVSHEHEMTMRIMSYILELEEIAVVNERIRSVLGELPVRLTKQKFFALVKRGLSVYKGGTKGSLDEMMYILRGQALLNRPEDMVNGYEELHSILKEFETADYKEIAAEEFRHLADEMNRAGDMLMDDTGELLLLMELVNDLYVLFISRGSAMMEVSEEQRLKEILFGVLALFNSGENEPIPEELTKKLTRLEGRQETYFEQWMDDGPSMEEIKELGTREREDALIVKVGLLLSGSAFMSLDGPGPDAGETVDNVMLGKEMERFFQDFSAAVKGWPRILIRAVMAKVLSCLPVFFESLDEVQEYVESSLVSCTDYMEKAITMKLIEDRMKEDCFGMEGF